MKITKTSIDALPVTGRTYFEWDQGDGAIKGFGVVVYKSGVKSYIFQYRDQYGRTQRMTLGKHGDCTPDQARKEAKQLSAKVTEGKNPAVDKKEKREALTVDDLLDEYLASEKFASKVEITRKTDKGRIDRHIRPLLGSTILEKLTVEKVRKAFAGIRDGKTAVNVKTCYRGRAIVTGGEGAARMAIRVLRSIFTWGMQQRYLSENPASGIDLGRDGERTAVLSSTDQYAQLFKAIDELQSEQRIRQQAADCIRVLALTGARRNEIAALRWGWVDLKRSKITLPANAHKTGKKTGLKEIALSTSAQAIIASQPAGNPENYVFPPSKGEGPLSLAKGWRAIRERAGLPSDLGIHGLRHSLATIMAVQGAAAPQIMAALGHRQLSTAARYIKTVDDARRDVIEKHTAGISAAMGQRQSAEVVQFSVSKVTKSE